jgi:hypothetical protein
LTQPPASLKRVPPIFQNHTGVLRSSYRILEKFLSECSFLICSTHFLNHRCLECPLTSLCVR